MSEYQSHLRLQSDPTDDGYEEMVVFRVTTGPALKGSALDHQFLSVTPDVNEDGGVCHSCQVRGDPDPGGKLFIHGSSAGVRGRGLLSH